jgi:TRAP-type mannitol/chloroaromatic compound transport system permease large subunit
MTVFVPEPLCLDDYCVPQMLKYKFDQIIDGRRMSGGTLGQLIPPSTVMIVYGTMTGSVGGLFAGGMSSVLCWLFSMHIYITYDAGSIKSWSPTML